MDLKVKTAPTEAAVDEWGVDALDLHAYLDRVGYAGPLEPSARALRALHRAHMGAVCFENLDIAVGRTVSIDIESIQRKLVQGGRGGYCYETNLLFAAALERLGFGVTRLLARIREGERVRRRFRSHTVMLVEAGGEAWLADPGYGYAGLIEPLPFHPGAVGEVDGWTWRLASDDGHHVLQGLMGGDWFDLYAFRVEPQYRVDYEMAHYCSSTRPSSPFVGRVIAQRGGSRARHRLKDRVMVTEYPDGSSAREVLSGPEAVRRLRGTFGTALTAEDERLLLAHYAALPPE